MNEQCPNCDHELHIGQFMILCKGCGLMMIWRYVKNTWLLRTPDGHRFVLTVEEKDAQYES